MLVDSLVFVLVHLFMLVNSLVLVKSLVLVLFKSFRLVNILALVISLVLVNFTLLFLSSSVPVSRNL